MLLNHRVFCRPMNLIYYMFNIKKKGYDFIKKQNDLVSVLEKLNTL